MLALFKYVLFVLQEGDWLTHLPTSSQQTVLNLCIGAQTMDDPTFAMFSCLCFLGIMFLITGITKARATDKDFDRLNKELDNQRKK